MCSAAGGTQQYLSGDTGGLADVPLSLGSNRIPNSLGPFSLVKLPFVV